MRTPGLREKDRVVLSTVVEAYLRAGRPVSSGTVHGKGVLPDSPATIRNIMAKLEELGFLSQPHASSGRVPTDAGLRYYVNSLIRGGAFRLDGAGPSARDISVRKDDLPSLFHQASRVLAEGSDSLGFVVSPRVSRIHFHHVRFVRIAETKVMIILATASNLVLTEIVATEAPFDQLELDRASHYLNESFRGRTLTSVRDILLGELTRYKSKFEQTFDRLMGLLRTSIRQDEEEAPIIVQGAAKLLGRLEAFDTGRLAELFRDIEEKAHLAKLLSDVITLDRVKVLIGAEANLPAIADCSLVVSSYGDRTQVLGSVGILGPKRIAYDRIIPLVDNVARKLSQTICQDS